MMDRSDNDGTRRPGTRPFVSGRPVAQVAPLTSAYMPARPFSFAGAHTSTTAGTRTTASSARPSPGAAPTPLWTVAVYEPGLEHVARPDSEAPALLESQQPPRSERDDVVEASLALAEDVIEAGRHASSIAAAEVLEVVARRLRRGEILLLPGASTKTDAAVVSSVLAALLGGRR